MSTWLQNRLALLQAHAGVVVITAPMLFGAAKIIAAMDEPSSLVWVDLERSDSDDEVSQGNKLADAVQRALGDPLFGYSMPFSYGLGVLRSNLNILGPLTFGLTGAEHSPEFARDLMTLQSLGGQVVVAFDSSLPRGFRLPPDALIFDSDDLKIMPHEVTDMTEKDLSVAEAMQIYEASEGAIERFELLLKRKLRQGVATRPTATGGQRLAADQGIAVEPARLLPILEKRDRWIEALELAVYHIPSEVPRVIKEAGHVYHERGLHKRLWKVLGHIPEDLQKEEQVLLWRLTAAIRLNKKEELREDVEDHLRLHEAPELRAIYATSLASPEKRKEEAVRAYEAKKTPVTALQFGLYGAASEDRLEILYDAVGLAEQSGRGYEIIRNASSYATHLTINGRYHDAIYWGEWALREYNDRGVGDFQRYLLIVNEICFSKVLVGDTIGLVDRLREYEESLDTINASYAWVFRSTLGDALIATGRPKEALNVYRINAELGSRRLLGKSAIGIVRSLIQLDRTEEAIKEARKALSLTENEHPSYANAAKLALGIALVENDPEQAISYLEHFMASEEAQRNQVECARAALNCARALQVLGREEEMPKVLRHASKGLTELEETGFRFLIGPEKTMYELMMRVKGKEQLVKARLDIRVLGREEIWLDYQAVKITPRQLEILVLLAMNPQGLNLDELMTYIVGGELSKRRSIVSSISELRKKIDISSEPYKITIHYEIDVLNFLGDLRNGRLRQALERYQGPLLPSSDITFIVEERELHEEALREAVLHSDDIEVLHEFSQIQKDDLEIWETLENRLSPNDPRAPIIHARVNKIRTEWG